MKRLFCLFALLLAACAGVPMSTIARLVSSPEARLLESDPAELAFAVLLDKRMASPSSAPVLEITAAPRVAGGFVPVDEKLPMQRLNVAATALGLPRAGDDQQWFVYVLPESGRLRMRQLQAGFKQLRQSSKADGGKGGTLSIGVKFEGLANTPSELAKTRLETWMRTGLDEGFLKMWAGSHAEMQAGLRKAEEQRKAAGKT